MPLRKEFFKEPMLRATPLYNLNDPFEGQYSEEQIRSVNMHQNKYLAPESHEHNIEDEEYHIQAVMENLQDDLYEYGVVSFTEDYSNLLMWSHYADEHNGFVLEIKNRPWLTNSFVKMNDDFHRYEKKPLSNIEEKALRVIYRDAQPKFELEHDALPDNKLKVTYQKLIKSILLTKADRWLYEKEHRSLLKISYADKIIAICDNYIEQICKNKIEIKQLGNGKCELNLDFDYDTGDNEDVNGDGIRLGIETFSKSRRDTIHLYHLNPQLITGIYFGCNVSKRDIDEIISTVKENNIFSENIKFKKAEISETRYELIFREI